MNMDVRRGRWMVAAALLAAVNVGGVVAAQGIQSASAATRATVKVRASSPDNLAVLITSAKETKSPCIPIRNNGSYTNTGFTVPTGVSATVQLLSAVAADPCDYNANRYIANRQEVVPDSDTWKVDFGSW